MNKAPEYRVGVGASSIVMIFIVLCLTTLGILSFSSARANLALTQRRTTQVQAYYGADAKAQRLIAEIDAALYAARETPDTYSEAISGLAELDDTVSVRRSLVTLKIPVGTAQQLQVTLRVGDADADVRFTIETYQLVNIEEWEPEEAFDLLQ